MTRAAIRAGLLAVTLLFGVVACGSDAVSGSPRPVQQRRVIESCPAVTSSALDPSTLVDRELVPLSPALHGRRLRFAAHGGTIDLYTGVAVDQQVEDLDFSGVEEIVGGRPVVFLQSDALPHIRLVQWHDDRFAAPCDLVSVYAQGIDPLTLRAVVAGTELDDSAPMPDAGFRGTPG